MSTTPRTPEELLARHGRAVLGYLVNRLRARADAEDLYQDVCLRVVRAWASFRHGDGRAWVFEIARNVLANFLARAGRRRGLALDAIPEQVASSPDEPVPDERLDRLRDCLGRLTPEQRQVVTARAAGRTCDELAIELSQPVKVVYGHAENGILRLKRCLGVKGAGS